MQTDKNIAIKNHKKNVLEKFKKNGDNQFLSLLTHTRVLLFSFLTHKKNHLSLKEKEEIGLFDDISKIFKTIDRENFINTYEYVLVNYTNTFHTASIIEAYDIALAAFEKNAKSLNEKDDADFFKRSKNRILQQYLNENMTNQEAFFDLYTKLAKKYILTKKEYQTIKKELEEKFDELLVLQVVDVEKQKKEEE